MKIALVTENTYCGGLDSFIVTLADAWPDPDDQLVLLCNFDHPGLEVIARRVRRPLTILRHRLPLAVRLLDRLRPLPGGAILAKLASPPARAVAFACQLWGMGRWLRRIDPDRVMVVNGGYPAGDSCRAATIAWNRLRGSRPKAIHNFHNLAYPPRWWDRRAEEAIDRLVGRAAGAFVAVSAACAASLPANRPAAVAGGAKVSHIHNGILARPAGPATLRAELGIPAEAPLALMLGTYEPRKGHDLLLGAFARLGPRLAGAHLVICGYGTPADRARVDGLVARTGIGDRIHTLGFRDDVPDLLAAADVLVVASQAFESFGLTLVEAMAQQVAVLGTRIGGIPEVVGEADEADCAGLLVEPSDEAGFAEALARLLEDGDLRRRLGRQGLRRYRSRFTAETMAAAYAALIKAV